MYETTRKAFGPRKTLHSIQRQQLQGLHLESTYLFIVLLAYSDLCESTSLLAQISHNCSSINSSNSRLEFKSDFAFPLSVHSFCATDELKILSGEGRCIPHPLWHTILRDSPQQSSESSQSQHRPQPHPRLVYSTQISRLALFLRNKGPSHIRGSRGNRAFDSGDLLRGSVFYRCMKINKENARTGDSKYFKRPFSSLAEDGTP